MKKFDMFVVKYGPIYNFVKIKLNFSVPGKLKINIVDYTQNIINNFENLEYILSKLINIPTVDHLLKIKWECSKLDIKIKKHFYIFTTKFLLCKRARPEI